MALPPVNPTYVAFDVWRWRPDVRRWVKVTTLKTIEEARARRDEEVGSARYRTPPAVRITRTTTTREEIS